MDKFKKEGPVLVPQGMMAVQPLGKDMIQSSHPIKRQGLRSAAPRMSTVYKNIDYYDYDWVVSEKPLEKSFMDRSCGKALLSQQIFVFFKNNSQKTVSIDTINWYDP